MFFNISFTETNSSWLMHDSIKALKIKSSRLLNLVFGNNTILSCSLIYLIIDLYFVIPTAFA